MFALTVLPLVSVLIADGCRAEQPSVRLEDTTILGNFEDTSIYGDRPVHGKRIENDGRAVESFIGIPFAEAPIGPNRFKKTPMIEPTAANLGTTRFNATTWSPGCMAEFGMFTTETTRFSEDCLYLNVFRRAGTQPTSRRPVIAIIYGGGYSAGDAFEIDWRGNQLAYFGDLVVVSFNYRLGLFGFLDLGIAGHAEGNMGHHDQVVALQWIRRYIRQFGGDPDRVTLFGTSAGAYSISFHLLTGDANGLFHSAVADAGVLTFFHAETSNLQVGRMDNFTELTNCAADSPNERLDCLMKLNSSTLLSLQGRWAVSETYTFRPTYRSVDLPETPEYYINRRRFASKVPLIFGDTTNEGGFLLTDKTDGPRPQLDSVQETVAWDRHIMANHQAEAAPTNNNTEIIRAYRLAGLETVAEYQQASADFIGDGLFICPGMHFAKQYSTQAPVYYFRWDRKMLSEEFDGERKAGSHHGLMFYTGAAGRYISLKGNLPEADANFIFWTIGMIANFAENPYAAPEFNRTHLIRLDGGAKVNNFFNEGYNVLKAHPRTDICRRVWNVFATESAPAQQKPNGNSPLSAMLSTVHRILSTLQSRLMG